MTLRTIFGTLLVRLIMNKSDIQGLLLSVKFYKTENGTEPVRDWLKSLSLSQKRTIGEDIKTVQYGWPIGMPVVRKIDTGLWEVRSKFKDGIARVLFTVVGDSMILLHGFVKKSQKTPKEDLNTANKRKKNVR